MAAKTEPFAPRLFRRFQAPDTHALQLEIAEDFSKLARAKEKRDLSDELAISNGLGTALYIAGNETQAAPMLERALEISRLLGDHEAEIYALFNLATARQYLDDRDLAQALFSKALDLSRHTGITKFDHYILHHQGRCFVEQGNISDARRCFQQALTLRQRLNDPRVKSSQAALDELAGLIF